MVTKTNASQIAYDGGSSVQAVLDAVTGPSGAASVGYTPAGTGAVATTVQGKLRESVSVKDFGADTTKSAAYNTIAIQNAIAACAVGGTVYGLGMTLPCTGVNVNKAITIQDLVIDLVQLSTPQKSQDAFTITGNGVTLRNCGAIVSELALPNTVNSAGVYSFETSNTTIDGGLWNGSINKSYTPGNYRGNIYLKDCIDPVVKNTESINSFGDQVWIHDCTRAIVTGNISKNAGGSNFVVYVKEWGLFTGNTSIDGKQTNSAIAVGGENIIVEHNYIKDAGGNGISHGEVSSVGGLIKNNTVDGYARKVTADGLASAIQSQLADRLIIDGNIILPPKVTYKVPAITVLNGPKNATITNNKIKSSTSWAIYVLNSGAAGGIDCTISDNTVHGFDSGIFVNGPKKLKVSGNSLSGATTANANVIHLRSPAAQGVVTEYLIVDNNTIVDFSGNVKQSVYLEDQFAGALFSLHGNKFLGWTGSGAPYSNGRSCIYDLSGNVFDASPKSGFATLALGATFTTVNSKNVTVDTKIVIQHGNEAAYTTNPKYRISNQINGAFAVQHPNGTAAGEQFKWQIM